MRVRKSKANRHDQGNGWNAIDRAGFKQEIGVTEFVCGRAELIAFEVLMLANGRKFLQRISARPGGIGMMAPGFQLMHNLVFVTEFKSVVNFSTMVSASCNWPASVTFCVSDIDR
jgi:hypothetical protein